ncbi:MAG: hypothetical protein AAF413_04365 [Patescibacteria group bacterium]
MNSSDTAERLKTDLRKVCDGLNETLQVVGLSDAAIEIDPGFAFQLASNRGRYRPSFSKLEGLIVLESVHIDEQQIGDAIVNKSDAWTNYFDDERGCLYGMMALHCAVQVANTAISENLISLGTGAVTRFNEQLCDVSRIKMSAGQILPPITTSDEGIVIADLPIRVAEFNAARIATGCLLGASEDDLIETEIGPAIAYCGHRVWDRVSVHTALTRTELLGGRLELLDSSSELDTLNAHVMSKVIRDILIAVGIPAGIQEIKEIVSQSVETYDVSTREQRVRACVQAFLTQIVDPRIAEPTIGDLLEATDTSPIKDHEV